MVTPFAISGMIITITSASNNPIPCRSVRYTVDMTGDIFSFLGLATDTPNATIFFPLWFQQICGGKRKRVLHSKGSKVRGTLLLCHERLGFLQGRLLASARISHGKHRYRGGKDDEALPWFLAGGLQTFFHSPFGKMQTRIHNIFI